MKHEQTPQAALPECLESPSGSSFGSREALGVAQPTGETKTKSEEKKEVMLRFLGEYSLVSVSRKPTGQLLKTKHSTFHRTV